MGHKIFVKRYFNLSRTHIAYLRFILESYDGLAFVRTLDPRQAVVEIGYPQLRSRDAEELIQALGKEIDMTELAEIPRDIYQPL
ncbi:MAG: DUF4911 domain-containing protein [Deltaproteobacteria bacterium]|nr:DUF4911 domain-containing protein [Deltaproteobacteria bacterium]